MLSKNGFNHGRTDPRLFIQIEIYRDRNRIVFTAVLSKIVSLILLIRVLFFGAKKSTKRNMPVQLGLRLPSRKRFLGVVLMLPAS